MTCAEGGEALCDFFGTGLPCYDEAAGFFCCDGDASLCSSAG